ncbi:mitochondrial translation release factor in rescue [Cylas formicarius]|uniref:mitochondrial translation release factor in rescue n=1 Tax=Cylas formicarius TaxID=197179 RepID=UPI002958BCF9|nr:mitochondrial translation release factor in rescue [Cylas formicarius]
MAVTRVILYLAKKHFSSFKKMIDYSRVPTVKADDLKEQFVRGSGPGGQKINKTASCVVLKHIPTGIENTPMILRNTIQNTNNKSFKFDRKYYSIKHMIDYSKVPKLEQKDLEEQHIKGSGPGGSKIASTYNCVLLKHIPTGIVVKCQETRYLEQNRKKALELLTTKLDNLLNGPDSIESQTKSLLQKKKNSNDQKKEKLRKLKEEWKDRENIT